MTGLAPHRPPGPANCGLGRIHNQDPQMKRRTWKVVFTTAWPVGVPIGGNWFLLAIRFCNIGPRVVVTVAGVLRAPKQTHKH